MEYTKEDTTKRYKGNKNCVFSDYALNENDTYQYGCEFEFYIDIDKVQYKKAIEDISKELSLLTSTDLLVDVLALPLANDKDQCMQLKPDISLKDTGVEISTPISSVEGIKHYIKTICAIIDKYGYTNEETGFHIHISTIKNDGVNFNFYKYMLLCADANLLSSWKPRAGYSQNVMDILSIHDRSVSRMIKTKKGTVWNLEKVDSNHVEIKSIGGDNYHKEVDRIINEFSAYAKYFDETLAKNIDKHKRLIKEHKELIDSLSDKTKASFVSALTASGIFKPER